MDIFYEESAVNQNARSGERKYKIVNAVYYFFLVLTIMGGLGTFFQIPTSWEDEITVTMFFMVLFVFLTFLGFTLILYFFKRRINVSFDYVFVSGELRIAKVFNVNKRKLVTRLQQEDILQVGDVEAPAFDRLRADPQVKEVVCTPNGTPAEGKFFMYVYVNEGIKKL